MRNFSEFISFMIFVTMPAIGLETPFEAQPATFTGTGVFPGTFIFATNVSRSGSAVEGSSDNGQITF